MEKNNNKTPETEKLSGIEKFLVVELCFLVAAIIALVIKINWENEHKYERWNPYAYLSADSTTPRALPDYVSYEMAKKSSEYEETRTSVVDEVPVAYYKYDASLDFLGDSVTSNDDPGAKPYTGHNIGKVIFLPEDCKMTAFPMTHIGDMEILYVHGWDDIDPAVVGNPMNFTSDAVFREFVETLAEQDWVSVTVTDRYDEPIDVVLDVLLGGRRSDSMTYNEYQVVMAELEETNQSQQ